MCEVMSSEKEKKKKVFAILTAGGSGTRMKQDVPKQFLTIEDRPVIVYTMEAFQRHPSIDEIVVVCKEGWEHVLEAYAKQFNIKKLKHIVKGGENGQDSIRNGLFEVEKHAKKDDIVLIHDGNRPMVSDEIISDCIRVTNEKGCAIAAIPCAEAILETEDGEISIGSYPRERLKRTQTPHGFFVGDICDLHRRALKAGITNSVASCTLKIELGEQVYFSIGAEKNLKLTTIEDIDIFKALLHAKRPNWLK